MCKRINFFKRYITRFFIEKFQKTKDKKESKNLTKQMTDLLFAMLDATRQYIRTALFKGQLFSN